MSSEREQAPHTSLTVTGEHVNYCDSLNSVRPGGGSSAVYKLLFRNNSGFMVGFGLPSECEFCFEGESDAEAALPSAKSSILEVHLIKYA